MNRKRLAAAGWTIGSTQEFLGLTDAEAAYIDLKLRLARSLRARREHRALTHADVAKLLHSRPSRVAEIEAGASSVSLDALVRSLLALGTSSAELAQMISPTRPRTRATPLSTRGVR